MADGESRTIGIDKWEQGTTQITTMRNGTATAKIINVLRVYLPAGEKRVGMPYWDITSTTLQAQMLPLLPQAQARKTRIRITKHGVAPLARFEVALI